MNTDNQRIYKWRNTTATLKSLHSWWD